MSTCKSMPLVILATTTLLGTLCVLDSMGVVRLVVEPLPAHSPPDDGRRLGDVNEHLSQGAEKASEIGGHLANHASNIGNGISDHWDEHGDAYKEKASEIGGHIANHASNIGNGIRDHWDEHGDAYKEKASEIGGHIANHASNIHNGIRDHWNEHGDAYKQRASEIGGHISHHASNIGNHVWNKGSEWGGHIGNHLSQHGWTYGQHAGSALTYNSDRTGAFLPSTVRLLIPLLQVLFAVLYYFTVVSNYPDWMGPTPMSARLQADQPPCATMNTSPTTCLLSWLCPQARAAHTFHKTHTLDYWLGLLAMFCCPFCTLCYANACTDLNAKLGGMPANPVMSCLCTWCCSPCVIAQDAESLDEATRVETGLCGVTSSMPYGTGPGMFPPQQGMYHQGPGMYPGIPGMHPGAPMMMSHGMPSGGPSMHMAPGQFPGQMAMPYR